MSDRYILLVEDTPDDQVLTMRALARNDIRNPVKLARDGQEALDYLLCIGPHAGRDPRDQPTVVPLDLKLPKIGGLEVLQRLRSDARTGHVPVAILTSAREEEDIQAGYARGCNSYVRKPVDFVQFADAVRSLGLYWLRHNEPPPGGLR